METTEIADYWLLSHGKMLSINVTNKTMEKLFTIGDGKDDEWCNERNSDRGFICTRTKGHSGPHIATSAYDVCALWPQK